MSRSLDGVFNDFFGKSNKDGKSAPVVRVPGSSRPQAAGDIMREIEQADAQIGEHMRAQLDELRRMTSEMDLSRIEREVERDFGVKPRSQSATARAAGGEPRKTAGIEGFDGIMPRLRENVIGQDSFLQRLMIAFKRPFVAGFAPECAKNSILLHGKKSSGRHTAVYALCELLFERNVLESGGVQRMDLSIYPTQGEEKLFLQDLYIALNSKAEVVVFDGYEQCHPAFLGQLADLVCHGRLRLNTRYVLQNGRLIDAGGALAPDAIGTIAAGGRYLVFMSEKGPAGMAASFGAPFVNALGDICKTQDFTPESLDKIARDKLDAVIADSKQKLGFVLEPDDAVYTLVASKYSDEAGVGGIVKYCSDIFRALADLKLERELKNAQIPLSAGDGRLIAALEDEKLDLLALLPGGFMGETEEIKAEFDKVVGLDEIKKYILALEDHFKVQQMRKAEGMKAAPLSMHMIFTGNPGTGKTTIARLVSKYLKAIGVLSGGQLIEVTRADLVGKYVGHTAPLTTQVLKSAIGGVLFVDEAYSLYRGEQDSFGLEAIDTLVKGIEDNRDNLVVILAGYSREMAEFMTANSGLRSRFPNNVEFPDYTGEQLREIANLQAMGKGYVIEDDAQSALLDYFNIMQAMDSRESGNGRLARNVVEKAILDQSRRIVKEPDKLNMLRLRDFDLFEE